MINDKWYSEPETASLIETLQKENEALKSKLNSSNELLKTAIEELKIMAVELSELLPTNHACVHCIYSEDCQDYFRECDYVIPWMRDAKKLIEGDGIDN